MEPPTIARTRLVRDYSDEDLVTPSRTRASSYKDDWLSPQRNDRYVIHEEPEHPDDFSLEPHKPDLNPSPINESSSYEQSVSTQPTSVSAYPTTRLADFFSPDVLHIVLHNPTTAHQLRKFARSRLCGENLDFLEKIDQYHLSLNQVTKTLFDIHRSFISVNSPSQVNLAEDVLIQVNKNLKMLLSKTMPNMESVFVTAQHDIEKLVASDIYPRFVRYQMTMSATRALATNVNKYAGLGDAFVLTNPNKADNPIVYASDGFVKVTGYKRNEIVPRNCRFLQNNHTDRESVKRIRNSLENPAECVELLLNQRKNGEPFWNLLYTAPLYHPNGRLAFFLGGQINVSSTIHNTSDILRILSYNSDDDDPESQPEQPQDQNQYQQPPTTTKSYRQSFLNTLRRTKATTTAAPSRTPGMETDLLDDLNRLPFTQQKEAFYSAYSKYLIVDTDTMLIAFHSAGIPDLFSPYRNYNTSSTYTPGNIHSYPQHQHQHQPHPQHRERISGLDIFKFLASHSSGGLPRDYKSRVKTALKGSTAITLDITLATSRVMGGLGSGSGWSGGGSGMGPGFGSEKFATHWTPLKNEFNAVGFIVVTLCGEGDRVGRGR